MSADYKAKYLDLRAKLMEIQDVSWRDGYAKGMEKGEQAAQQQAQEEQMMMEQQQMEQEAAMNGQAPEDMTGVPPEAPMGEEGGMDAGMMPEDMGGEQGSELDSHISELESMVSKGEKPRIADLRKAVAGLTDLRKSQKNSFAKKTEKVITGQKNLVDNILKKWESETESVTDNLEEVIKTHGIKIE